MVEIKSPVTVIEESTPNQPVTNNSKHTTASSTRSAPHTKRRKVSIACHECRIHKTKCDGAQPMCSSCARKKLPENACIYNPDRGRRGIKNQYVQLLEDKVKELEKAMNKQTQPSTTPTTLISLPPLTSGAKPQLLHTNMQNHLNIPSSPSDNLTSRPLAAQEQNIPSPTSHTSSNATNLALIAPQERTPVPNLVDHVIPESPWMSSSLKSQPSPLVSIQTNEPEVIEEQDQHAIDAMGAVTSEGNTAEKLSKGSENQGYFGSSSAGRFMEQIHEAIDKKSSMYGSNNSLFSGSSGSTITARDSFHGGRQSNHRRLSSELLSNIVLPPRKIADGLLESYWMYVHTLYPFLHKPSFMKTYAQLWGYEYHDDENNSKPYDLYESENEPLFQCILNLVFALGCQLSPDTNENEREVSSDLFFQRSKKLLHFDLLEAGNVKVVQALLLMGQYLQCTKLPGRCWIVVGLAIRVAQGIGLHLEKKNSTKCCHQLERELKRRLWGGCLVLDRVISMAYGRPFMIPLVRDLKLPEAIDDEILAIFPKPPAVQPENKPSRMAFFVHTIELYEIMGEILLTLYSEGDAFGGHIEASARSEIDEQNLASSLNSILKLEKALDNWKFKLPLFLKRHSDHSYLYSVVNDEKEARLLLRQSNVLNARYLHICILLYRPLLVFYFTLEESNQQGHEHNCITDLQRSLFIQSSQKCVKFAQDLIKTISQNIKAQLPAWWYSVFYLYTAATVLLMGRLFPKVREIIGEDSLLQSWNDCLQCMSEYQSHGSAKNCYRYFTELDKHVWAATHEQSNNATMSSIQILGTLPLQNHGQSENSNPYFNPRSELEEVNLNINQHHGNDTTDESMYTGAECDLDLMHDMSWLGRLPVYTDIESGYQPMDSNWGNLPFA